MSGELIQQDSVCNGCLLLITGQVYELPEGNDRLFYCKTCYDIFTNDVTPVEQPALPVHDAAKSSKQEMIDQYCIKRLNGESAEIFISMDSDTAKVHMTYRVNDPVILSMMLGELTYSLLKKGVPLSSIKMGIEAGLKLYESENP